MILSGSRYHLALVCAYPFRPDVSCPERPGGEAAKIGTSTHTLVECHFTGEEKTTDRELEARPIANQAIKWLSLHPRPTAVEVAIIYNAYTDTAREVKGAGHRNYGTLDPGDIPTTLDLVWTSPDSDVVTVRDLKTGSRSHAHVEQLEIQALAASRLYGKKRAQHGFLWARKTKCDGDPLEEMGPGELEAESWRAASAVRSLPMAMPVTGSHCYLCPLGRENCPAHSEQGERLSMTGE